MPLQKSIPHSELDPEILKGVSILVVDDNRTTRQVLRNNLTLWGMQVTEAESIQQALNLLSPQRENTSSYAMVLLDAYLPGIDQFEVARHLRATVQNEKTALILLTSTGQRGDATLCREIGIEGYLSKPVFPLEMRNVLVAIRQEKQKPSGASPLITRHTVMETLQKQEAAPQPTSLRALDILLSEDNVVNQRVAVRLLEKAGHKVTVAVNGQEAVEKYQANPFDLVLMDIQMPVMDGLEATAKIRQLQQEGGQFAPIVAMTAHALAADRERCLAAGMDDYISKPIDSKLLKSIISRLFPSSPAAAPPQ